jgi:hypothetical protein
MIGLMTDGAAAGPLAGQLGVAVGVAIGLTAGAVLGLMVSSPAGTIEDKAQGIPDGNPSERDR